LRNLLIAGVLVLALAIVALLPAAAQAQTRRLVALGDSLTQGYGLPPGDGFVPQLQAWLDAEGAAVSVINAGVSGDTTAGGLSRLDWTLSDPVDAMIVALGGNDLLRAIPPEEARRNLDAILARTAARGIPVLLVPVSAPGNYGADYKHDFDAIYPDLAARHGALLAGDILAPILNQPDRAAALRDLMQPDGIHPNARGVGLVVAAIGPRVLDLLAGLN
jgi:acyl-CoA thioesterase-1